MIGKMTLTCISSIPNLDPSYLRLSKEAQEGVEKKQRALQPLSSLGKVSQHSSIEVGRGIWIFIFTAKK